MKSIFLFDNQSDDTISITASSEVLPVTNVQNSQRTKIWRSGLGTESFIQFQLNQAIGADYLALVDLNLTTGGSIRIQAWDDGFDGMITTLDATFSPSLYVNTELQAAFYGQGAYGIGAYGANQTIAQEGNRNITLYPFGLTTISTYYRITFTDLGTDFQQLGGLFLGQAFEFDYNIGYGVNISREDRAVARESIGGQRYVQRRDSRLRISADFPHLNDEERTRFLIRYQQFVNNKPFIYSVFPENSNRGLSTTVYGRFEDATTTHDFFNNSALGFSVIEEL